MHLSGHWEWGKEGSASAVLSEDNVIVERSGRRKEGEKLPPRVQIEKRRGNGSEWKKGPTLLLCGNGCSFPFLPRPLVGTGEGGKQHLAVPCAVPLKTNIMRQSIWGGIRPTWENHPSVFEEDRYLKESVNQSIDVWRMSYQEEKCALSSLLPSSSSREH